MFMEVPMRIADRGRELAHQSREADWDALSGLARTDFVDPAPPTLRHDAPLRQAAAMLEQSGGWGVPVLDANGDYLGVCTARSLIARSLPVMPTSLAADGGLAYLRYDVDRLRAQVGLDADRPVAEILDTDVPVARASTSLPQLLVMLCRRHPMVPILSDKGHRLLGIATWARAVTAIWPPG
jgi:CBS-domain-containing membrane protein